MTYLSTRGLGRIGTGLFARYGDLLSDPSLPLSPENLRQNYSRNPYNAAVAELEALTDQREERWNQAIRAANGGQLTPGAPYPGGTAAQLEVLRPEIEAATAKVRSLEARINAIEAARRALTPAENADNDARSTFESWFEGIFKPNFSSTMGATTNEDTLRREILATWAPGHPEWVDEVIAWVRSSPVAWKLARGSNPPPVPGATAVTYPDGTVVHPEPGQDAPPIPSSTGWTDATPPATNDQPATISTNPHPTTGAPVTTVTTPAGTVQLPDPTGRYIIGGRIIDNGRDVGPAPAGSGGAPGPSSSSEAPEGGEAPAEAGFGLLGGLVLLGIGVGLLKSRKRRPAGFTDNRRR